MKRSNNTLKWLILIAAGLFVFAVGSLWWGGSSFSDKGVTLTLEASERATSGDEITYVITYRNDTRVELTDLSFRMFYPTGSIVIIDGEATRSESEGFIVDKLGPGESGAKELKVFMVGDKGMIRTARVNLIFKAGDLRSSFEKEATVNTTITALPVVLTLVAPPQSVSGQTIEYILDVRNESGEDMSDLKVMLTYPDGFSVQKMDPVPGSGNTVWNLAKLNAGDATRIKVTGGLSGNERETKTVTAVLQHNLNGQYVDYVSTEAFTMISSPLLSVTVSPEDGRDYVAFPGDTLRYVLTYKNNSRFTLLGLLLGVRFEGDMYDTAKLRADDGFYDDATRTLVYDSAGIPNFSSLSPGASGKIFFSIPLKSGLSGSSLGGAKSFFVKATARLSTPNVPSGVDGAEVSALDSVITKIGSQPTLSQSVLYDDGAGTGPLPPKVGAETVFTIRWQLTNPGNDVRDSVVTATLPPGVTFKDAASATHGTPPVYNRTRNTITWSVGLLPFGTGNGTPRYEARFQISIKPASNQVGSSVSLVGAATLQGTDSFTGQAILSKLRDWSTDSIEGHPDDGRVQQ